MSELRCWAISRVPKLTQFVIAGDYYSGLPTPKPASPPPYPAASKLENANIFFSYKMKRNILLR